MAKRPGVCAAIAEALGGEHPPRGAASELARKLGRDTSVVSRWVAGTSTPDPAAWPSIEEALDMEPGTLSRAASNNAATRPDDLEERVARLERDVRLIAAALERSVEQWRDERVAVADLLAASEPQAADG